MAMFLLLTETAGVVFQLFVEPVDPLGIDDPDEDFPNQLLLVFGEVVSGNRGVGDVPIVLDMGAELAAEKILVVPVEGHIRFLLVTERFV